MPSTDDCPILEHAELQDMALFAALISLLFPMELPNKEIWNLKVIKIVTVHVRFHFAITFVTHGDDE